MPWALVLALLNAGNSMAARMAMMAMTTSSSINVKPDRFWPLTFILACCVYESGQGARGHRPRHPSHPPFNQCSRRRSESEEDRPLRRINGDGQRAGAAARIIRPVVADADIEAVGLRDELEAAAP